MDEILNTAKTDDTISAVFDAMTDRGLTVAEAILVIRSIDATLKANYPEAYEVMAKSSENPFLRIPQSEEPVMKGSA